MPWTQANLDEALKVANSLLKNYNIKDPEIIIKQELDGDYSSKLIKLK